MSVNEITPGVVAGPLAFMGFMCLWMWFDTPAHLDLKSDDLLLIAGSTMVFVAAAIMAPAYLKRIGYRPTIDAELERRAHQLESQGLSVELFKDKLVIGHGRQRQAIALDGLIVRYERPFGPLEQGECIRRDILPRSLVETHIASERSLLRLPPPQTPDISAALRGVRVHGSPRRLGAWLEQDERLGGMLEALCQTHDDVYIGRHAIHVVAEHSEFEDAQELSLDMIEALLGHVWAASGGGEDEALRF